MDKELGFDAENENNNRPSLQRSAVIVSFLMGDDLFTLVSFFSL
jgi:hypothetical protein